jgi:hypothetical protein
MDKDTLMQRISKQPASTLLELLNAAYEVMNQRQRKAVFGQYAVPEKPAYTDGKKLLRAIKKFQQDSLAGKYYAPFNVNSKNWMRIPDETEAWFAQLGQFLTDTRSVQLTGQGQHAEAVACFGVLYELIAAMEDGEEIVFADELGSWMIPVDEKKTIAAYLKSLAAIASPEQYATVAVPLIKRDSRQSFADKVYASALRAANKAQKAHLLAEIERQQVKAGPTGPQRRARRK